MRVTRTLDWIGQLETLAAAAVGGAANAGLTYLENPASTLDHLKHQMIIGAIVGVLLFLKKSPLQPKEPPQ